jgi:hypothetical protein
MTHPRGAIDGAPTYDPYEWAAAARAASTATADTDAGGLRGVVQVRHFGEALALLRPAHPEVQLSAGSLIWPDRSGQRWHRAELGDVIVEDADGAWRTAGPSTL